VCNGQLIIPTESGNPCGRDFTLSDGVTYRWEGCGGDTWVMWENGEQGGNLGDCVYQSETWDCGGDEVVGNWLCG